MSTPPDKQIDPWALLRRYTFARIGLGHAGGSIPTQALLEFRLAHAKACDAVYHTLDLVPLRDSLRTLGLPLICVHSQAADRVEYLQRPDLGRKLRAESRQALEMHTNAGGYDVVFMIGDGLSAYAIEQHTRDLLAFTIVGLHDLGFRPGPLVIAEQARVALGDEVGELLKAKLVVVMIGERPGLSSPDSVGAYLTWAPKPGRTDAQRNCISNIRPRGLPMAAAADKLLYLIRQAYQQRLSGVQLKDESGVNVPEKQEYLGR